MKNKYLFLLIAALFFFIQETQAQMSGIYSIGYGAGDDYQTLFQALQALQTNGADDSLVFELSEDYNPASESYPVYIQAFTGASEINTLTIRPASGTTHVIETATDSIMSAVFTLIDSTSHIIIDGSNNGTNSRDLTIINTAEINQTAPIALFTSSTPGTNITVKNCILKAHSNTYETAGIFLDQFTDVTIENNEIMQSSIGIIGTGEDITIINNIIGSDLQAEYVQTAIGINNATNINVSNNVIKKLIAAVDDDVLVGSYLMNITGDCSFNNNKIDSVINTGTGAVVGLFIRDCIPSQMNIVNNHFSHIASDNYSDQMPVAVAVDCPGMTSGMNILYNSIYMDEDNTYGIGSGVDNGMSAGVLIHQGEGIVMKNNIILNSLGERNGSIYSTLGYAVVCSAVASPFAEINNNVYYSNGDNDYTFLALANGAPVNLADWQTWTSGDANSFYEDPLHTSVEDLNLQACSPAVAHAVDITEVTTDIDGNTRDTEYPTMGAYEYEKVQAENVAFDYPVKGMGLLFWDQGTGCNEAVFMKQGHVLPEKPAPVNGTTYTADTNFGTGDQIGTSGWYCVYNSFYPFDYVEILGEEGMYTVMVCEYFGDVGNEIYLTESATDNPFEGFLVSDIDEINSQFINIYPNPSNGKIIVEIGSEALSNIQITEINIIDITGKEILQINNISQQKFEIDLSNFGRGIYFIKVSCEDGVYTKKLILE